ncbi:Lipase 1 [Camponotus floridanus]|uniref:Lipase 1 n=1 Tax=Camponotus floridanus TaxID=104421 RepID=E2AMQ7_CAMFO|nr:Lipase 1 [Camponotus floridanus]
MKLIGLMYLLSFCNYLSAATINGTDEISMLIRRIIWTDWNQFDIELNPDSILDTPEMVRKAGYLVESHVVTTEDGYFLTLHRIPGGNDSLPVLLQHGGLCSSADWVRVMQLFFHDEFFQSDFVRFLLKKICLQNISLEEICSNFMFMIWGDDREQFNNTLLPVILNHFPTSVSAKTLLHYVQIAESDKFRKFDYGRVKNLLIYNSMNPPYYDLSNITVPIALSYADNDWFISIEDVKRLYHLLPNVVDMYDVPWSKFNQQRCV